MINLRMYLIQVKDLGQLRYFLEIEITRGAEGIVLSQMKYVLSISDKLKVFGM
jgi:hypothetical protein